MHLAARSSEQAAEMYSTWQAAHELPGCAFSVKLVALDGLGEKERLQLQSRLARSTEGIARRDPGAEWVIDSDGWATFGADEMERPGLRIFQMRDPTPIEALVLAEDYDSANELFQDYLRRHGGDPDTLLSRELGLHHLGDDAAVVVREALGINRDGVLIQDDMRGWVFITPLAHRT